MHTGRRRFGLGLFLSLLLLTLAIFPTAASRATEPPAKEKDPGKIRIVLAGDSTVTDTAGWGKGFAKCMDDNVAVINLSKGGRSSKSFAHEGWWKKCLELKPDYVLIQFGHNDQKPDEARHTDPDTGYREYMTRYVDEARAAGIKPVLVTSLSRRQWGEDGKIHSTLVPYVEVVKQIAADKKVPLIDLHARSIELYEKLGKEGVRPMEPLKDAETKSKDAKSPAPAKVPDGTHLNAKGSEAIGKIVAAELKKVVPDLASHVSCGE